MRFTQIFRSRVLTSREVGALSDRIDFVSTFAQITRVLSTRVLCRWIGKYLRGHLRSLPDLLTYYEIDQHKIEYLQN